MSSTAFYGGRMREYNGIVKKLELNNLSQIEFIKKYIKENNLKSPLNINMDNLSIIGLLEAFGLSETMIPVNNDLYKVINRENTPYKDIFKANHNQEGTIDFTLKYYDGGCCFNEAIEKAINSLKGDD